MINMTMRDPDLFEIDAVLLDDLQNGRHVATRIDHHTFHRLVVEQNGAILLEWCHRNDTGLQLTHETSAPIRVLPRI